MTNKPMLRVERDAFEAFWRATMNVEVMDLHRCEFPMTAYDDQPYACHETDRSWMTWKGRSLLDNQAAQHQGEPVALQHIAVSEGGVLRWMTGRKMQHCELYAMPDGSAIRSPLYAEPPAPVADGTTSDKYKAELYDEVWQKARDMGFANVTDALAKLSAPVAVVMPEPYGLAMFKMLSGFDSVTPEQFNLVWTACRKEVARLNGVTK